MCETFNEKIIYQLNKKLFEVYNLEEENVEEEEEEEIFVELYNDTAGTISYTNSIIIGLDRYILEKITDLEICKSHENNFKLLHNFSKKCKELHQSSKDLCDEILGVSFDVLVKFKEQYTNKFWREIQSRKEYLESDIESCEKLLLSISSIESTKEFNESNKKRKIEL